MIGKKCGGAKAPPAPPGSAGPEIAVGKITLVYFSKTINVLFILEG